MKLVFDPTQILYHGTIDLYAQLLQEFGIRIIKRGRGGVDFGPGFYTTVGLEEQAKEWAQDKLKWLVPPSPELLQLLQQKGIDKDEWFRMKKDGLFRPVVVKYRIKDPERWQDLNKVLFESPSLNWKDHVWIWREAVVPPEHDWVFGPVADGGRGQTSSHTIQAYPGMNQLSIHNNKTLEMIEFLEVITW